MIYPSAFGLFLVLALFETFPLISHLTDRMVGHPQFLTDQLLITWILSWDTHALLTNPARLSDANIFYPLDHSLAFSEHLLGVWPLFAAVYLLSGNPIVAYNALFILSFALSGFSAFCLAYYWTRAFGPSLVAGTLFGFAPIRFAHMDHLQLLNFFWAPLALIFLDRFLRARRWRDLGTFALLYWLQCLSSIYLAFMMTTVVALYVGYHLAVDRSLRTRALALKLAGFVAASAVVLLPIHLPYLHVNRVWQASRDLSEVLVFSPGLLGYLSPPLMSDFYVRALDFARTRSAETSLFPGLLVPLLVLIGSCCAQPALSTVKMQRLRRVFGLVLAAGVILSLGPYLGGRQNAHGIPLPYLALYYLVPGWAGMRAPGRFAFLAVLAAVPIAALGVMRCRDALVGREGRRQWAGPATCAGLIVLIFLELGPKTLPLASVASGAAVPDVYRWLATERPGPIVELPFGLTDDHRYMYFSTLHWLPVFNGQSGFYPKAHFEMKETLAELPAPRAVGHAAALGIRAIVVHTDRLSSLDRERWQQIASSGRGLTKLAAFGADEVYAVPPVATAPTLTAELALPAWLSARTGTRVGLRLRPAHAEAWAHPRPHGNSPVVVEWTDRATSQRTRVTDHLQLPLAIAAGDMSVLGLPVSTPPQAGSYVLTVSLPSRGIATAPRMIDVRSEPWPTSMERAPGLLSASYVLVDSERTVPLHRAVDLDLTATNTGRAVWLAHTANDKGAVRLGWRWLRQGRDLDPALAGRVPIDYDVFPGDAYQFRARLEPPSQPETYTLELSLVSEHIAWFFDTGSAPLRLDVTVRAAP